MKLRIILLSALLFIVFILAAACSYIWYQFNWPQDKQGQTQEFIIISGQGAKEIALNLKNQGLIRDNFWFDVYLWLTDQRSQLKAGEYQLSPAMGLEKIVAVLSAMPPEKPEIKITFPEGIKTQQIAQKIAEQGLLTQQEFLGEVENISKYQADYAFLADMPDSASLDGFLFPDTYRFYQDSDVETVVKKMMDNFNQKLTSQMRQDITNQGKTIFEIIVMASIIEKEVASEQDRAIVSGIFWHRLADNYPLQSCATIAYALNVDKWRYSDLDLQVNSPYNTYKNLGLPPGPICNPGLSAIKAAAYPQQTDYYYFLSASDGQTIFSKTLEEHNQNKAKYLDR